MASPKALADGEEHTLDIYKTERHHVISLVHRLRKLQIISRSLKSFFFYITLELLQIYSFLTLQYQKHCQKLQMSVPSSSCAPLHVQDEQLFQQLQRHSERDQRTCPTEVCSSSPLTTLQHEKGHKFLMYAKPK